MDHQATLDLRVLLGRRGFLVHQGHMDHLDNQACRD